MAQLTANQISLPVGKTGLLAVGNLRVPVRVVNARTNFGRVDIQVEPIGGSGQEWVETSRVVISSQCEQVEL